MASMSDDPSHEPVEVERLLASGLVASVQYFDTLGSTQDRAHELARGATPPLPLLVVAEEQTAGRGRGQNQWWTGRGSLAFSLLIDPAAWGLSAEASPQRSLAAGVAIVDTLAPHLPHQRVGLHWPNDVYAGGRKLAGVLVDVLADDRHVIGIGLNVNNPLAGAPADVMARAASMCELACRRFDRTALLVDLLAALKAAFHSYGAEPAELGQRFNALCLQIGEELTVDVAGRQSSGICQGIGPDGALLLQTPAGLARFYSGVLSHRSAGPVPRS